MATGTTKDDLRVTCVLDQYGTTYRGTAAQLLAAGVVELRHLPVLGNQRKMRANFTAGGELIPKQGRSGWHSRIEVRVLPGKSLRYQVFIRRERPSSPSKDKAFSRFMHTAMLPVSIQPEANEWPFRMIRRNEWEELAPAERGMLEDLLRSAMDYRRGLREKGAF